MAGAIEYHVVIFPNSSPKDYVIIFFYRGGLTYSMTSIIIHAYIRL